MTPEEITERRRSMLRELDEAEARALELSKVRASGSGELLERIRGNRERLLGTAPPIKLDVSVPAGATPEQKRQAVLEAITAKVAKGEIPSGGNPA